MLKTSGAIPAKNLSVKLDSAGYKRGTPILKGCNLSLDEGELALLVGPSGCGKTTLLLAVTGVLSNLLNGWVNGEVRIGRINPLNPDDFLKVPKEIGVVLQDPDKQISMPTPLDEISFTLENLGFPEDRIERRAREVLKEFGLLKKKDLHVENLSGGEKRRLTFATAIVHDPKIVFLDEPTASVDPWGIREIKRYILDLKKRGTSGVIIEHKAKYFLDIIDKVFLMKDGKIIKEWTKDEITQDVLSFLQSSGVDVSVRRRGTFSLAKGSGERILEVRDLSVGYNGSPLLRRVNFEIRSGEIVALVGPNGSGKTTLLKTLVGALKPLEGEIIVKGKRWEEIKKHIFKDIFYVPQHPDYLFVSSTVEEELMLSAVKRSYGELEGMFPWVKDLLKQSPHKLSLGQRRWLSLVVAWGYAPSLMLLDEPSVGLDFALFQQLKTLITRLRDSGTSFLISTHDPRIVIELAHRILLIEDGTIKESNDLVKVAEKLEAVAGLY